MELMQLKYFKTVAEIGKISDAAQSLFISAPALSTSISRLEKELGIPLFDRTNNRIKLNRQGQIFLRYVNQIFSNLECAKTELQQSIMHQGQHVHCQRCLHPMGGHDHHLFPGVSSFHALLHQCKTGRAR